MPRDIINMIYKGLATEITKFCIFSETALVVIYIKGSHSSVAARPRKCANHASFRFGAQLLTNNGRQSRRLSSPVAILLFADPHSFTKSPTFSDFMGECPHNTKIRAATLYVY